MARVLLKDKIKAFEDEINAKIYKANAPIKRRMGKRDENIKAMTKQEFADYLYSTRAGRHTLTPGMIKTKKELASAMEFYERNPIHEGQRWSKETKRDMLNLMTVNDILGNKEHKDLEKKLKGLNDAQARELLSETTAYKDTIWVSETDLKSHKTGKHCEETARVIITQILREMGL